MKRLNMFRATEMVAILLFVSFTAATVKSSGELPDDSQKARAEASQDPPAELLAVEQALKPILENLDPQAKISFRDSTMVVTYLPQTFKIHGRAMSGAISERAHDQVGPSYKGFVLAAHLQPAGEVNQAETPQTIREPYWHTDLDVTPIAETEKQIYWALSYGSRMEQKVLDKIRRQLKALGELPLDR